MTTISKEEKIALITSDRVGGVLYSRLTNPPSFRFGARDFDDKGIEVDIEEAGVREAYERGEISEAQAERFKAAIRDCGTL